MKQLVFDQDEVLLVASRGKEERHGLWLWKQDDGQWQRRQVGIARDLSSLAGHPTLPVVYGTAGIGQEGMLHAWRIDRNGETDLGSIASQGAEPCHLEVDPSGRLLVATNYTSSTLALQRLDQDGAFTGPLSLLKLSGGGPEVERQDDAHPHQAFFIDDRLIVIDLGADLIREFAVDFDRQGAEILNEVRTTAMPAGTGPRHGVVLTDGRLAVSGELGENLVVGHLGTSPDQWANVRSTRLVGPAKTRWSRNYPGDIRRSIDGRHVYFANRSYDSLATFDVSGTVPTLVDERDTRAHWPQHILVRPDHVLVAGWDSSKVMVLPLKDGIPQKAETLFECDGAGWLHAHRIG